MPHKPVSLATQRLVLRPCATGDEPALVAGLGDVEVQRWLEKVPHPYTLEHAREWIVHTVQEREAGRMQDFAITLADGALIGGVALRTPLGAPKAELGYWIARPQWGQGYGTEAISRVVRHAVEECTPRYTQLSVHIAPANAPSRRLVERLGFVENGSAVCAIGPVVTYQLLVSGRGEAAGG